MLPPFLPDGSSPLPLPPLPLDPSLLPPGFMHQFLPPGFMPPPPSHPGEHRPPPLGRMSSPPLNRFSPAPGDFNFDRMSPRPSVRSYRSPPIDPERFHHMPPPPWDDHSSFRPVANQRESRHDYPGAVFIYFFRLVCCMLSQGRNKFIKVQNFWQSMEIGSVL